MPAATNKSDLLAVTERDFAKLMRLLARFDEHTATFTDGDGYSACRIIGHRAAWIDLYFDWCREAAETGNPAMPKAGYSWQETPKLNADIWETQRAMGWAACLETLENRHAALMDDIKKSSDAALYGQPLAPVLKWTRGRYAEAAGASHYRSALTFLRKHLKAAEAAA